MYKEYMHVSVCVCVSVCIWIHTYITHYLYQNYTMHAKLRNKKLRNGSKEGFPLELKTRKYQFARTLSSTQGIVFGAV